MKRKTIALYTGEVPPAPFLERLALGLAQMEYSVLLMGSVRRRVVYDSPFLRVVGPSKGWTRYLFFLRYAFLLTVFQPKAKQKLDRMLQEEGRFTYSHRIKYYPVLYHKPDVFHLQWAKSVADWAWVKHFGMRYVVSLRGAHINYSPICDPQLAELYRTYFPEVDDFHAVSEAISQEAQLYLAPAESIRVIYSGLSLSDWKFRPKETPSKVFTLVSVGRAHWIKAYPFALDVAYELKQKGIVFRYELLGVEPTEELLFQCEQLNLLDSVFFLPPVPPAAVSGYIQKADVLFLPSYKEGIANVVLEAMALGTLVVSSDSGGMTEVVRSGVNGFVFPTRDVEGAVAKLLELQQLDAVSRLRLLENARATIEAQHSAQLMLAGFESLYSFNS